MSEGDDSEDEHTMLKSSPLGARSSISRRSKSAMPSYAEADADDEAVDRPIEDLQFFDGTTEVDNIGQGLEQVGFRLPTAVANGEIGPDGVFVNGNSKRVKAEFRAEAEGGESDVSDFQPRFGF